LIKHSSKLRGIIFDMDNTLLSSNINFREMKIDMCRYLIKKEIFNEDFSLKGETVAELIKLAEQTEGVNIHIINRVWEIVTDFEREGLKKAELFPGVFEVLERLHEEYHLVILTNNSEFAALDALKRKAIASYFEYIIGREKVKELKPSPKGLEYILTLYPDLNRKSWIFVGDSWMDGAAASKIGIKFLYYGDDKEILLERGIEPVGQLDNMKRLLDYIE